MKTKEKILFWLPRILCIAAILFISYFSLDAFEPGPPLGQQILDFLIHNIPSYILILVLILAWKKELIGGIIFLLFGIITSPLVYSLNIHRNHSVKDSLTIVLLITFPFIIIGILFILSHLTRKRSQITIMLPGDSHGT